MKKTAIIIFMLLLSLALLVSCTGKDKEETTEAKYCTVTFNSAGGGAVEPSKVLEGNKVTEPTVPERDGYIFDGWLDSEGKKWYFTENAVKSDTTLTAKWLEASAVFDYAVSENEQNSAVITLLKSEYSVTVRIPKSIKGLTVIGIGDGVFEGKSSENISKIILPDTVVSVGKNAFKDCSKIQISVLGVLTYVGEGAFLGCDGLAEVELGEGITEIEALSFGGCASLESITLPSTLTKIGENAFEDCTSLVYVIMHGGTKLANSAFVGCSSLVTVYYNGSAEDFDSLFVEENDRHGNEKIVGARLYLYSAEKPASEGSYWYTDDKGKIKIWK